MTDNGWSADANAATRKALMAEIPGTAALALHCKNAAGGFGQIEVIQSNGTIEVTERGGRTVAFPTIEAFIQGGWTLD